MPKVNGKHYAYTPEGMAAAEEAKKRTTFTMKYSNSAFPFKSPIKQDEVKVETKVKEPVKKDSFLENLKKTNPEAYSVVSPHNPSDTLYYMKQGDRWVQTW